MRQTHAPFLRIFSPLLLVVLLVSSFPFPLGAAASTRPTAAIPEDEAALVLPPTQESDFTVSLPAGWPNNQGPIPMPTPSVSPTPLPTWAILPTPLPAITATSPAVPGQQGEGESPPQILVIPASNRGYLGGLDAAYYDDTDPLLDCPTSWTDLVATEKWGMPINFDLRCNGQGPEFAGCKLHPALTVGTSYMAIWQGRLLVPSTGDYTFYFRGVVDDGGRLFLDNAPTPILDAWCNAVPPTVTKTVRLEAGMHPIEVRFHQGQEEGAVLHLKWQGPGFAEEVIPVAGLPNDQCNCSGAPCELGYCGAHFCVGGEIDTASGNHIYHVEDMSVPIVGGRLSFERTYASQGITATVLGYGWTHSYAMHLLFPSDPGGATDQIIVSGPDGARLRYIEEGDGTYTAYPGIHAALTRQGSAPAYTYRLTGSAQTAYTFDNNGYLQTIVDTNGHTTTLSYTPTTHLLSQVSGPDGQRYLAFRYDAQQRLREVRDHTGRHVSFTYNGSGDLAMMNDVRGQDWTYTYTGAHLLHEVLDPNDHVVEDTEYDVQGRAVRQTDGVGSQPDLEIEFIDAATRVITDARGSTQRVSYDVRNTLAGVVDAGGGSTAYTRDLQFNIQQQQDANGRATEIAWNDCGCMPRQVINALGLTTTMSYDDRNNLTAITDTAGNPTHYAYSPGTSLLISSTNAVHQTTLYTYSTGTNPPDVPSGLLIEMQAPGDRRTYYHYDEYGQLTATVQVSGATWLTTTYEYNLLGQQISTTTPAGRTGVTFYDAAGHITRTVQNCTAGSYTDCRTVAYNEDHPDRNIVTENEYDPAGNLVFVTNTLGVVTRYDYDAANRLITLTENYEPGKQQNEDGLYNVVTEYGYDEVGNQVYVTDTYGLVDKTEYDGQNRAPCNSMG